MCEIMERINEDTKREVTARINKLYAILLNSGRTEDAIRMTKDSDYQKKLLKELVPEED